MAGAMAAFTLNDTITKAVSSELNIGEIIVVRGLFAQQIEKARRRRHHAHVRRVGLDNDRRESVRRRRGFR